MTRRAARAVALGLLFLARAALGADSRDERSSSAPVHTADTGVAPSYRPVRYLEEHGPDARSTGDLWAPVKHVPLWTGGHLSFGGQHRLRYELVDPVDLGVAASPETSSVLLSRNLVHADLFVLPELRVFGQLGSFHALGVDDEEAEPPDADDLDVTQLFVESRAAVRGTGVRLVGRAGRQEMPLGSTRWVSTRDGTNVRQAFDLVRATLSKKDTWSVETFLGVVPRLRRGVFDDAPNWQDRFWGTYATVRVLPSKRLGLEVFYLGRQRPDVRYRDVSGREVRHTFGARVFGETSFGLEHVAHALVQVGAVDDASVLAWGFAGALWQRLPGSLRPVRLGVRSDALSGDARPGDGRVTTFHPLFPNQTFYSALPAFYPTNVYDVHPLLRVEHPRVTLEAGCVFFWRQALADAIYQPPGRPLPASGSARYTAAQTTVALSYRADEHLAFNAEWAHVFAGPGLDAAGGQDVDFFGTWTTYTY